MHARCAVPKLLYIILIYDQAQATVFALYGIGSTTKASAELRDLHNDKRNPLLNTYPADFSETTS